MSTIMEQLKEIFAAPGWKDELAEQLERVQILEEGAADMDEKLEICKHLHLLSIQSRKGRKVGFADEGTPLRISAQAAVLCFKRCIEICDQLRKQGQKDFRIIDQLNRSYYGISDLLLRGANSCGDEAVRLSLLQESRRYAMLQHDLLEKTIAEGTDEHEKDFAAQFIDICNMQLEDIDGNLQELKGN